MTNWLTFYYKHLLQNLLVKSKKTDIIKITTIKYLFCFAYNTYTIIYKFYLNKKDCHFVSKTKNVNKYI